MSGAASSAVRRPFATMCRTVSSASVIGLPSAVVERGQPLAGGGDVDLAGLKRAQDLEARVLQRVGRGRVAGSGGGGSRWRRVGGSVERAGSEPAPWRGLLASPCRALVGGQYGPFAGQLQVTAQRAEAQVGAAVAEDDRPAAGLAARPMRDVAPDVAGDGPRLDRQAGAGDQARVARDRLDGVLVAGGQGTLDAHVAAHGLQGESLDDAGARGDVARDGAQFEADRARRQQPDVTRGPVQVDAAFDIVQLDVAGDRLVALLAVQAADVEVAADRAESTRAPCGTSMTRSVPPPLPIRRPHLKEPMLTSIRPPRGDRTCSEPSPASTTYWSST